MIYYVHDCMAPATERHDTLVDAMAGGEAMIELYRGEAGDGWGDINISVYACDAETDDPEFDGKEVATAVECNRITRPDDLDEDSYSKSSGEWWNPDWDYTCDYQMKALKEPTP